LIQKGANININNGSALSKAIIQNFRSVIDVIMECQSFVPSGTHLLQAIEAGNVCLAKKLFSYPFVDPSIDGNLCIKAAVSSGLGECVELLLNDSRVDPSKAIVKARSLDILDMLLKDPRVDPSINKSQVLVNVVERGDVRMVRRLA
jgi:hypothetical protein